MNDSELWLRRYREAPKPSFTMLCFPHAGGGASTFRPWARLLPAETEVSLYAVQYPGRLDRMREPPAARIADLADPVARIATALPGPVLLFGHSLGAVVAHEVAARMEAASRPPLALAVAGREAPRSAVAPPPRTDEELVKLAGALGGAPEGVFDEDEELRELLLAPLRADSRLLTGHRFIPFPVVNAPILAYCGRDDPGCTAAEAEGWREVTRGDYVLRMVPGGHFPEPDTVAEILADLLARLGPRPVRAGRSPI